MVSTIAPIAETFVLTSDLVNGCWISAVDIFFDYVAVGETQPVTVQINTTLNGYPTANMVEGAFTSLEPSQITASPTGVIATKFIFSSLVKLQPNVEYALVVSSNSNAYRVWTAVMGAPVISNPSILVTTQPYVGSFFQSSNGSTWTANQSADLTFNIYRASFNTNTECNLRLVESPTNAFVSLPPNPFSITNTSTLVKVHHINHCLAAGMFVAYTGCTGTSGTQFNATFKVTTVINNDYYIITTAAQTVTNHVGGSTIMAEGTIRFSSVQLPIFPTGTDINVVPTLITSSAIGLNTTSNLAISGIPTTFTTDQYVYSSLNKAALLAGANSFNLNVNMVTYEEALSPVIRYSMGRVLLASKKINNPTVSDISLTIDGVVIATGVSNIAFGANNIITLPAGTDFTQIVLGAWITIVDTSGTNDGASGYISAKDPIGLTITTVGTTLNIESGRSAVITQYMSLISETFNDGTAEAKHITVPVKLTTTNTNFRVLVDINVQVLSEVDMYYRTGLSSSAIPLSDTAWTNYPIIYNKNATDSDFTSYEYNITKTPIYDKFQFKFVFRSSTTAYAPSIKNLSIISYA